jgi:hypothetical protein
MDRKANSINEAYQSLSHSRWDCKHHVVFVAKRQQKALFGNNRRKLGGVSGFWGMPDRGQQERMFLSCDWSGGRFMAKVIGIHRLVLKPGVNGADFEEVMKEKVFTGLGVVIQLDKTITHGLTMADWAHSEHSLMLITEHETDADYVWLIEAQVPDEKVSTEEGRLAAGREAQAKIENFFEVGSGEQSIASLKIAPFATRTSFATFLEVAQRKLGG